MKNLGTISDKLDTPNVAFVQSSTGARKKSTAYSVGDRAYAQGKPGYLLVCSTGGTTDWCDITAIWPAAPIQSGVTQIVDNDCVWVVYDLKDGFLEASSIPVRASSANYVAGERALFPNKYGYLLVCTTAGTTAATAPLWPSTIVSGTTTLTDGTTVWTIYDLSETTAVVDNLTSTDTDKALSANQGKTLQDSKQRKPNTVSLSSGAIDLSLGDVFEITVSAATAFTVANAETTSIFVLKVINGGTNVTWPAGTKWSSGTAPTLQAAGLDVLTFMTTDGGSSWIGFKSALNVS